MVELEIETLARRLDQVERGMRWWWLVAVVAGGLLGLVGLVAAAQPAPVVDGLRYSTSANRTNLLPLKGAQVGSGVTVYIEWMNGIPGLAEMDFLIDGNLQNKEVMAPWDMKDTGGRALVLPGRNHTITIRGRDASGKAIVTDSASFTVGTSLSSGSLNCANPRPEWIGCWDFQNGQLGVWKKGRGFRIATEGNNKFIRIDYPQLPRDTDNGGAGYAVFQFPEVNELFFRVQERLSLNWDPGSQGFKGWFVLNTRHRGRGWGIKFLNDWWGSMARRGATVQNNAFGVRPETHFHDNRSPFNWKNHLNEWVTAEMHVKLNTHNPDGTSRNDGIFREWVNGVLTAEYTNVNIRGTDTGGIHLVQLTAYFNCAGKVRKRQCLADTRNAQHRDVDNIVISTQRIGVQDRR